MVNPNYKIYLCSQIIDDPTRQIGLRLFMTSASEFREMVDQDVLENTHITCITFVGLGTAILQKKEYSYNTKDNHS